MPFIESGAGRVEYANGERYLAFGVSPRLALKLSPLLPPVDIGQSKSTGGLYNFYLLFVVLCWVLAGKGVIGLGWVVFWTISVALAFLVDDRRFSLKLNLLAVPVQLFYYAKLTAITIGRNARALVLTLILYGLAKPIIRRFDPYEGFTFVLLYGYYLVVRTGVFVRYMWVVRRRWDSLSSPPFAVKMANLRDRKVATRHLVWSYLIGNVGVSARCGKYAIYTAAFDSLVKLAGWAPRLDAHSSTGMMIAAGCMAVWLVTFHNNHIYYDVHRAAHRNAALYDGVHRIHHTAQYPTLLDSGTECPAEFVLTEASTFMMALPPSWVFLPWELYASWMHFAEHHAADAVENVYHVNHHRFFECNFGFPYEDRFGMTYREAALSDRRLR